MSKRLQAKDFLFKVRRVLYSLGISCSWVYDCKLYVFVSVFGLIFLYKFASIYLLLLTLLLLLITQGVHKFFPKNFHGPMTLPSIFDMIFHDSKEFPMTLNL